MRTFSFGIVSFIVSFVVILSHAPPADAGSRTSWLALGTTYSVMAQPESCLPKAPHSYLTSNC